MGAGFFPSVCCFSAQKTLPGRITVLSQRKSLFLFFFYFIQLFCSLAQELTVGVVTRLLLPTYCRASQELHHLASEDQLSGNTFAFAHVAQTPFSRSPVSRAQSMRSGSPRHPRSTAPCTGTCDPRELTFHGHRAPPNHPKSSCNMSRSSLPQCWAKVQKPGYLVHPG